MTWVTATSNEYGHLLTGIDNAVPCTDTMEPIKLSDIPINKTITYGTMLYDHRPLKTEKYRCCLVVGGDKLMYNSETAAPAANLLEAKLIINSTISTPGAKFITVDIKDFFLSSQMPEVEYIKMNLDEIPQDIISKYNMNNIKDKIITYILRLKKACMA